MGRPPWSSYVRRLPRYPWVPWLPWAHAWDITMAGAMTAPSSSRTDSSVSRPISCYEYCLIPLYIGCQLCNRCVYIHPSPYPYMYISNDACSPVNQVPPSYVKRPINLHTSILPAACLPTTYNPAWLVRRSASYVSMWWHRPFAHYVRPSLLHPSIPCPPCPPARQANRRRARAGRAQWIGMRRKLSTTSRY